MRLADQISKIKLGRLLRYGITVLSNTLINTTYSRIGRCMEDVAQSRETIVIDEEFIELNYQNQSIPIRVPSLRSCQRQQDRRDADHLLSGFEPQNGC